MLARRMSGMLRSAAALRAPVLTRNISATPALAARTRWAQGSHERRHMEQRVLPFTPQELFKVVADVESYSDFVPWCTRSRVLHAIDDQHFAAELAVGFNLLSERYTSLVTTIPYESVTVDVPNSSLFDYLVNDWSFKPGKEPGTTELTFFVEFRFRNPIYQRVTDRFFNAVVMNMVSAFEMRAHKKQRDAFRRRRRDTPPVGGGAEDDSYRA